LLRGVATLDGLLDRVWDGVGTECRELTREVLRIVDSASPEDRPKLLASFCWANWCRGRRDIQEGREGFWALKT
jgi:hypothetical protein